MATPKLTAPQIPKEHIEQYGIYMRSDAWAGIRKLVLERDAHSCQACCVGDVLLHVHHLTYSRLFREHIDDLICLCVPCHDTLHDVARKQRAKLTRHAPH